MLFLVKAFLEIFKGLKSLWGGLKITGTNLLKPTITTIYPMEEVDNISTFHGHIELVPKDDDPMVPKCIACAACARVCPSDCIIVTSKENRTPVIDTNKTDPVGVYNGKLILKGAKTPPASKKSSKEPEVFDLNYTLCSLCGLCISVCPAGAIRFSNNVYLTSYNRDELSMCLIERMKKQSKKNSGSGGKQ